CPCLGDQYRVVAGARRGHAGADRNPLRGLPGGPEPDPGMSRLAAFPPRLQVVGAADPVEARLLGLHGLAQEIVRRELLVSTEMEVAHGAPIPAATAGYARS